MTPVSACRRGDLSRAAQGAVRRSLPRVARAQARHYVAASDSASRADRPTGLSNPLPADPAGCARRFVGFSPVVESTLQVSDAGHAPVSAWSRRGLVRVPQIGVVFWLIKALTTALGESTSDWSVHAMAPAAA